MTDTTHERLLIIDFGSQVTQLIARRVREAGVYSEIVPFQSAEAALDWDGLKGIILSGGPASSRATVYFPFSDRRLARTQPADPPPTMTKSNSIFIPLYQKMRLLVSFLE